jgi:nicotinic acid mononucleotide adenylyltransferase
MPFGTDRTATLDRAMAALSPEGPPAARLFRRAPAAPGRSPGVLVVLDASFNPLTAAHEAMLTAATAAQPADEVLLLLSSANVDKGLFGASLGQRLAMLLAYVHESDTLSVGGCSHARFVDKAVALKPLYPEGIRFEFVIGYDTLLRLFDPSYYEDTEAELRDLFSRAAFLVANRGADGEDAIRDFLARPDCAPFAGRLRAIRLSDEHAAMSSTQVRRARAEGRPYEHMVPERVAQLIEQMDLYREA